MVKTTATSKIELASTARPAEPTPSTDVRPAFTSAAIGMSWQLAIVVLVPIVGGYKLDQALHTSPAWTLTGLVLAMVGSILVIRRALAAFGNFNVPSSSDASAKPADTGRGSDATIGAKL